MSPLTGTNRQFWLEPLREPDCRIKVPFACESPGSVRGFSAQLGDDQCLQNDVALIRNIYLPQLIWSSMVVELDDIGAILVGRAFHVQNLAGRLGSDLEESSSDVFELPLLVRSPYGWNC
jgi:hypothetical protein